MTEFHSLNQLMPTRDGILSCDGNSKAWVAAYLLQTYLRKVLKLAEIDILAHLLESNQNYCMKQNVFQ